MKKLYIQNGVGGSGKDLWAELLAKHIPTYKYSIIDLPKEAAKILGWNGGKTERDRKFLSDLMDLSTKYNDAPFMDVISIARDFELNFIDMDVLLIDMRDPRDISRAVDYWDAETILIKNPRVESIESNHADRDVEEFNYNYTIINDGTIEQLEKAAIKFIHDVILRCDLIIKKPYIITCSEL